MSRIDRQRCLETIESYFLERMLDTALREPVAALPFHYLVPGGSGYSRTMWDWDALFLGIGLLSARPEYSDYLAGTARNFLHNRTAGGYIPNNINDDGSGFVDLHRQGLPVNPIKPVLAQMATIAIGAGTTWRPTDDEWAALNQYLTYWDRTRMHATGLYTLLSHRGSGSDNDPTVYGRPYGSTAHQLVNALMVRELQAMQFLAALRGETHQAESYANKASALRIAINETMWDAEDAIYYAQDVGYRTPHIGLGVRQETDLWSTTLKARTGIAFSLLWAGVPDRSRAPALVKRYLSAESELLSDWGVRSLSDRHRLFNNHGFTEPKGLSSAARKAGFTPLTRHKTGNPSNWQGPVWIINNYFAFKGLMDYGFRHEAESLFDRTCELLARDIVTTGTSHENYHSETGAGLAHTDFMCWNLTVFAMRNHLETGQSIEALRTL